MIAEAELFSIEDGGPGTARGAFARHETFHPRHGWLKKGYDAALEDPSVFTRDDAAVVLGVGKNMVRAIRYWCLAFKVLESRAGLTLPTEFGTTLLGSTGWDPYLEDLASLWLLHNSLLSDPSLATAWDYAFFGFAKTEFTLDEMVNGLEEHASREFPTSRTAAASFRKDVSCILRMYAGKPQRGMPSEESIQCPFVDLGLMTAGSTPDRSMFVQGDKPGLAPAIIAAACLQFAHRAAPTARTISFSRLLRDRGSPGMAFKLTEPSLYAALEAVADQRADLGISDSGGIVQVTYGDSPPAVARELLDDYYSAAFAEVIG